MYLGNLARDPAIPTPVQPNSSAVLAVFMFIGVFGLTYVRNKFAQGIVLNALIQGLHSYVLIILDYKANFACIFASMIAAVSCCMPGN